MALYKVIHHPTMGLCETEITAQQASEEAKEHGHPWRTSHFEALKPESDAVILPETDEFYEVEIHCVDVVNLLKKPKKLYVFTFLNDEPLMTIEKLTPQPSYLVEADNFDQALRSMAAHGAESGRSSDPEDYRQDIFEGNITLSVPVTLNTVS